VLPFFILPECISNHKVTREMVVVIKSLLPGLISKSIA
jgi:hypothetical protein